MSKTVEDYLTEIAGNLVWQLAVTKKSHDDAVAINKELGEENMVLHERIITLEKERDALIPKT